MKVIYIISLGHSGSTLLDCILGTHPNFCSSGELCYLGWQLVRTQDGNSSVEAQNICSCGRAFRECLFWSKVLRRLSEKVGIDIADNPRAFDTAYFKKFSYAEQGGFHRSFFDKAKSYYCRRWLPAGFPFAPLRFLEPRVSQWVQNNWLLYSTMNEVSRSPVIVDSSKNLSSALLLQKYHPDAVYFLFLHRSLEGLASSYKRRSIINNSRFEIMDVVKTKREYIKTARRCKNHIPQLLWREVCYEDLVNNPLAVICDVASWVGTSLIAPSNNSEFRIDPSLLHLVAGNPMRYKGSQLVKCDERWRQDLNEKEQVVIHRHSRELSSIH